MFNEILAPNLSGDGTGCDNMTAILVNFSSNKSSSSKNSNEASVEAAK